MEKTRKRNIEDYFEVDDTQLEETLNNFLSDEIEKPKTSKFNIASVAGFAILVVSAVFSLGYFIPGIPDMSSLLQTFTVIGGILIVLTGLGTFTRSRKSRKKAKWNYINDEPVDSYGLRQKKRLFRSRKDKKLFGVCGGLAEYFGIDATFVRVIFIILAITYGSSILLYIILALVLPKKPQGTMDGGLVL